LAEIEQPVNIAIIGGGFCGIITAMHLLRHDKTGLHVHIINNGSAFGKGVAYSPHTCNLLLNVPNGRMGAFADRPADYLDWLHKKYPGQDNSTSSFSTRQQYGEYLCELWDDAINNIPPGNAVTVYDDTADDITGTGDQLQIQLRHGGIITAGKVVLATGNAKPRLPNGIHPSFTKNKRYFADPWQNDCVSNIDGDILLIGNGLTTADTIIGLIENGFERTIYSVSPHGYRLQPWVEDKMPYTGFSFADLPAGKISLHQLLKAFNKHRKIANAASQSVYPVIDSLRPHIQKLWLGFDLYEKQRFLKYLKPYWEKVRHRLPVAMHQKINSLRSDSRFQPYKGQIVSVKEAGNVIEVLLNCDGELKTVRVQRIINCTGPAPDIRHQENILLNNLVQKGLIAPGPCGLGINAGHKTGNVINPDGVQQANLYVAGSNLKGVLWETTAVPELRLQAQNLARHIIAAVSTKNRRVFEAVETNSQAGILST
jgi:uncharacterized NAD(P)/FAD-binding protein YdhS